MFESHTYKKHNVVKGQHEDIIFFSSYSYLGLLGDQRIQASASEALETFKTGSHAVMLLGGYTHLHRELEEFIARLLHMEASVLYPSGYMANLAAIATLLAEEDHVICDVLAHTSIVDGCQLSGAQIHQFSHQDPDHLDAVLKSIRSSGTKLVIVDGVFSLRGDIIALPDIVSIARKHGALIMVDDSHGLGAIGKNGFGVCEYFNMLGQVDIITASLGKSIPSLGGFIACSESLADYLRAKSNGYIYSSGMSPIHVAAAKTAFEILENDSTIMARLRENTLYLKQALRKSNLAFLDWDTPIMPILCTGSDDIALVYSRELMKKNIYIAPLLYPAVPQKETSLRLTVTASHTIAQIDYLALQLVTLAKESNLNVFKDKSSANHKEKTEP
jgi:glycine C-acetyltransferase